MPTSRDFFQVTVDGGDVILAEGKSFDPLSGNRVTADPAKTVHAMLIVLPKGPVLLSGPTAVKGAAWTAEFDQPTPALKPATKVFVVGAALAADGTPIADAGVAGNPWGDTLTITPA